MAAYSAKGTQEARGESLQKGTGCRLLDAADNDIVFLIVYPDMDISCELSDMIKGDRLKTKQRTVNYPHFVCKRLNTEILIFMKFLKSL